MIVVRLQSTLPEPVLDLYYEDVVNVYHNINEMAFGVKLISAGHKHNEAESLIYRMQRSWAANVLLTKRFHLFSSHERLALLSMFDLFKATRAHQRTTCSRVCSLFPVT